MPCERSSLVVDVPGGQLGLDRQVKTLHEPREPACGKLSREIASAPTLRQPGICTACTDTSRMLVWINHLHHARVPAPTRVDNLDHQYRLAPPNLPHITIGRSFVWVMDHSCSCYHDRSHHAPQPKEPNVSEKRWMLGCDSCDPIIVTPFHGLQEEVPLPQIRMEWPIELDEVMIFHCST